MLACTCVRAAGNLGRTLPRGRVMCSDHRLIEACLAGDTRAWEEFVDRYQRLLYSIPRRQGLSPTDAEDVLQITFGIALRKLETLRDETRLSAWLIRVAYRESWRLRQRRDRTESLGTHDVAAQEPSDADLLKWEQQHIIRQELAKLDGRCRRLIAALFFGAETPSYERVAQELGMPLGSIGPTRARCFQKLERLLKARGL